MYLAHLRRSVRLADLSLVLAGSMNPEHSSDPANDVWQQLGVQHLVASYCNMRWHSAIIDVSKVDERYPS
jgi:hypothetical protein